MKDFLDRFNNIEHINKMLKVAKFNNKLLIPIKILKKMSFNKYNLIIGNKEIETKSYIELEEGVKYWAELSQSDGSGIKLSNLKRQPALLQMNTFPISFELEDISKILQLENPAEYIKTIALEALSDSDSKYEFEFLINLLSSIEQNVLTIPFIHNKKYNFMQISPINNGISFFITTNNLGAIKGSVLQNKNEFILNISTFFKNGHEHFSIEVKKLLEKDFSNINIQLEEDISALFSFRQSTSFSI